MAGSTNDASNLVSSWDPFANKWSRENYSAESVVRTKKDLAEIFREKPHGIHAAPNDDDIATIHGLVVGPVGTPYEGGLFHFLLRTPPTYPYEPPRVKLLTTGGGTVRFNPNLYMNGKVCLSIIGTWPGPAWTAAQSLLSVLVSIQSLMNERPYHNEPGYEKEMEVGAADKYNDIIAYETLRVAVCETMENYSTQYPAMLTKPIKQLFRDRIPFYITRATQLSERLDGQTSQDVFTGNKVTFNFNSIIERLRKLKQTI
jgi:ubiquitin-conjugating enzyme E2 Z